MKRLIVLLMIAAMALPCLAKGDWRGKVVDENGEPVAYANVAVLSKTDSTVVCGVVTQEDGSFNIVTSETDGITDSLNGSERGEDGTGAAAKPGAEVSCRQKREASGSHQIKGSRKDSFFCYSNRSCHNRCSVSIHYKSKHWGRNVQPVFKNNPQLSTLLSISFFISERWIR